MLRIGMLFIFQTLSYSFCLCVRNTPKSVTFVIGKMKLVSFSLFLDALGVESARFHGIVNDELL